MSSTYNPNTWVTLHVKTDKEDFDRVFAGWYGGFARGDSWKMNSGIVKIEEAEYAYDVHGVTGSIYTLTKDGERMSMYQATVLHAHQEQLKGRAEVTIVSMKDILEKYK